MENIVQRVKKYFFEKSPTWVFCAVLVIVDIVLSYIIVRKVPYTEIDWKAYMEEVEGYESGERNYLNIKGNTGPLVYPAGFLYIFGFLKRITGEGTDIFRAQVIFAGIYIVTLAVSLVLYAKGKLPAFCAIFLILSKRVHSIFMLRMFNDCIAVLFGLISIILFCNRQWKLGSVLYSLAVSVKMNMLLFAPGVLAVYLLNVGYIGAVENILICGIVQVVLGFPFLSTFPIEYISKAFELSRVFYFKWTVNFKFLPEDLFLDKRLSLLLLLLTLTAYAAFSYRWTKEFCKGFRSEMPKSDIQILGRSSSVSGYISWNFITFVIFASNFIGIAFARSLHYQFYCWYFFTLPFLLFQTNLPNVLSVFIMGAIEYSFNVFPATAISSLILQLSHVILLLALWTSKIPFKEGKDVGKLISSLKKE
jgi:alpha-1,3-mannosyltransferase